MVSLSSAPAAFAACDSGSSGGLSVSSTDCAPLKKARIVRGKAIAPASAPARVKKVIAAANRIRNKPYIYGGGHGRLNDRGYDCSGSVSYALRAGGFVKGSMPSGGYIRWKRKGIGRWITTYANGGHMYMVVAGISFDTSNMGGKKGNRWSTTIRSSKGFSARHPGNY
ncbi:MAG: peptidoglycan endopeptidase [Actinomycetota bacterium]|nr:peptidoglycan endopeptidase [Actinomycetota bacterium]